MGPKAANADVALKSTFEAVQSVVKNTGVARCTIELKNSLKSSDQKERLENVEITFDCKQLITVAGQWHDGLECTDILCEFNLKTFKGASLTHRIFEAVWAQYRTDPHNTDNEVAKLSSRFSVCTLSVNQADCSFIIVRDEEDKVLAAHGIDTATSIVYDRSNNDPHTVFGKMCPTDDWSKRAPKTSLASVTITHWDNDHAGGFRSTVDGTIRTLFKDARLIHSGAFHKKRESEAGARAKNNTLCNFESIAPNQYVHPISGKVLLHPPQCGAVYIKCVAANFLVAPFSGSEVRDTTHATHNASSIGYEVGIREVDDEGQAVKDKNGKDVVLNRFYTAGDLGVEQEQALADEMAGRFTGMKVSHHGSNTSTPTKFLDAVKPLYAVISHGKNTNFGHPTEKILQRLSNTGVRRIYCFEKNQQDIAGNVRWLSRNACIQEFFPARTVIGWNDTSTNVNKINVDIFVLSTSFRKVCNFMVDVIRDDKAKVQITLPDFTGTLTVFSPPCTLSIAQKPIKCTKLSLLYDKTNLKVSLMVGKKSFEWTILGPVSYTKILDKLKTSLNEK